MRHMGTAVAPDPSDLGAMITPETVHVTNLSGRFDMSGYVSPYSDIVALLVLEHQAQMLNLITRVGWEARVGGEVAHRPFASAVGELGGCLLFGEAAAPPGPTSGPPPFAKRFSDNAPRDTRGRSLRDLDLTRR